MKTDSFFSSQLFLVLIISVRLSAQSGAPITNFSATPYFICAGEAIQFSDLSQNSPSSWVWTFTGGSPATSTLQNPVVVYNNSGKYNVILTASNTQGTLSKGELNMVTVMVCSSVREYLEDSDVRVFPNPTMSFINVLSSSDARFTLSNAIGSVLVQGSVKRDEVIQVNLETLAAGIYFFSFQEGLRTKNFKIVKE